MGSYRDGAADARTKRMTIKEMSPEERPRERLLAKGAEALSDAELLAIIIRDGTPRESAIDLARRLVTTATSLRALSEWSIADLEEVKGIGPARAAQIKAALELASRLDKSPLQRGEPFTASRAVFDHFHPILRGETQECFLAALLDTRNKLIRVANISKGGLNSAMVNPRDLLHAAVRDRASAVIVVHNHPSGDPSPSRDDLNITRRLKEVCELTGLRFLDHLIIGDGRYVSLADEGKL